MPRGIRKNVSLDDMIADFKMKIERQVFSKIFSSLSGGENFTMKSEAKKGPKKGSKWSKERRKAFEMKRKARKQ